MREKILMFYVLLILASFFMVVGERLVTQQSFLWGRSKCTHCQHPIPPIALLPVIGYVRTRGKCPHCQLKIPWHYPVGELFFACGCCSLYHSLFTTPFDYFVFTCLFIMGVSDWVAQWVPDRLQLLLCLGGGYWVFQTGMSIHWITAILCLGGALLMNKVKPSSIGGADIKLLVLLFLFYPTPFVLWLLLWSSGLALLAILLPHVCQSTFSSGVPFISFIAFAFPIAHLLFPCALLYLI